MIKVMMKVAAIFAISISFATSKIAPIGDYQPQNDVSPYLALSEDLRAIDNALIAETEEGFKEALDIYSNGAFSDPFVLLTLDEGLPFDVPLGTALIGTDNAGNPTTVVVAYNSYKAGANAIEIVFRSDPPCRMSSDPNPELLGCLVSEGELSAEGQASKIKYSYVLTDIRNYHTIRNLSVNANSKFRPHGTAHASYFKDFQRYVDFFGSADFADQIITAAFNRQKYVGAQLELDFSQFNERARRSIIVHTTAFLVINVFVTRELETALVECDHGCGASGCNKISIDALDEAVALYTGSVFEETGKGNLMYGLAEKMCVEFRTCGPDALKTSGESKINIDIFREFKAMQKNLDSSQCLEAKINKEVIIKKMAVPLIQATYLAMLLDADTDTPESRAERVVFTTTVLPLMYHCDHVEMSKVVELTNPLEKLPDYGFDLARSIFISMYRCLDVTCQDVGGIWNASAGAYKEGEGACDSWKNEENEDDSLLSGPYLYTFISGMTALIFLGCCALKQYSSKKKKSCKGTLIHFQIQPRYDSEDARE
ncbi:hypothetical protein ACA910_012746 [Epithemia clementina (nom. ined.)]